MASAKRIGVGLVGLAVATMAAAWWTFDHHYETVALLGAVAGVTVAVVGLLSYTGRYDLSPGAENRLLGVLVVFGSVGAFGLVVTTLMLLLE